jgi:hypothetical protein
MPGDVPGELPAFDRIPTAVSFCLRLEAGPHAVTGHHPIRFEREQIFCRRILSLLEWPA